MSYWLTTHWPPAETDTASRFAPRFEGVWLPDGRESAGHALAPGDLVLVYEAKNGPTEVRQTPDGTARKIKRVRGAEGIAAIARVTAELSAGGQPEPTKYANGREIWWRWLAPTEILSRTGFVGRSDVNEVLGYRPSWNLHGFGDRHSGLKRVSQGDFQDLEEKFTTSRPISLPIAQTIVSRSGSGTGIESAAHRLLKEYIAFDPSVALDEAGLKTIDVEYKFGTGDRADCVLADRPGRIIGVEIEVSVGDAQLVGMLQAIKYRYMLEPLTERSPGDSRAFLVAHEISEGMRELCERYSVECFIVSKEIVDRWAATQARPQEHPEAAK